MRLYFIQINCEKVRIESKKVNKNKFFNPSIYKTHFIFFNSSFYNIVRQTLMEKNEILCVSMT